MRTITARYIARIEYVGNEIEVEVEDNATSEEIQKALEEEAEDKFHQVVDWDHNSVNPQFQITREDEEETFINFEFDPSFAGSNYKGTGDTAFVPISLIERFGDHEAFRRHVGLDPIHIIHYGCEPMTLEQIKAQYPLVVQLRNEWYAATRNAKGKE